MPTGTWGSYISSRFLDIPALWPRACNGMECTISIPLDQHALETTRQQLEQNINHITLIINMIIVD